jgi:hypothetical protein
VPRGDQLPLDPLGVRVSTFAEQRQHLRLGHLVTRAQPRRRRADQDRKL